MRSQVEQLVAHVIRQEDALGWQYVRRVPSTYTWKTVDYLRSLDDGRRARLLEAFAFNALSFFGVNSDPGVAPTRPGNADFEAFLHAMPLIWDWQYADVRFLRGLLGDQLGKRPSAAFADTPLEILQRAQSIRPTQAREIRKTVKQMLGDRFGAKPESLGGGDWRYAGTHRGHGFVVSIDYGGWDQLRYTVRYTDSRSGLDARRLSYERLIGAGLGHWDFLTADNLEEAIGLLCELVERLVELPDVLSELSMA